MKAILILAAALMTAATVYGIMDYNRKSGSKAFKQLYTTQKSKPVAKEKTADGSASLPPGVTAASVASGEMTKTGKKRRSVEVRLSEFSRESLVPVEMPDSAITEKEIKQ
jgi:hypothetical protein